MAWADHVRFYLDANAYGGVVPEKLLAAIVLADNLYCALVFALGTTGAPTVEFWERLDDLERSGFAPIPLAKARAISDALPRFLDQLERAEQQAQRDTRQRAQAASARPVAGAGAGAGAGAPHPQRRWSAYDPTLDGPAVPPELEARLERHRANTLDRDAYEGG